MSNESQSEKIWQYAMQSHPANTGKDAKNASLTPRNEEPIDDVTTEFSDVFGSIPMKFNYHGLANTQSQAESQWGRASGSFVDGPESEAQNERLRQVLPGPKPGEDATSNLPFVSSSLHPINDCFNKESGLPTNGRVAAIGHVTNHVTSASPSIAIPIDRGKEDPGLDAVPKVAKKDSAVHATPLKFKDKAVSFHSPGAPPQVKPVSRINTMPPRLNRYAPRDIDQSSQDSFAGPSIPRDLNSFVRDSKVLNNTFVRSGKNGKPTEVFEVPSHVSTTSSQAQPQLEDNMPVSQSEFQDDDEPTASQLIRAALDPRLSLERMAPQPIILVKDSQSPSQESHYREESGNDSMVVKYGSDGESLGESRSGARESPPRALTPTSSSSSSYALPSEMPMDIEPTQPNSQGSTQPATQPATPPKPETQLATQPSTQLSDQLTQQAARPTLQLHTSFVGSVAPSNTSVPSPFPVPAHRLEQINRAKLERQRQRRIIREEIIPETPLSTIPQSVPASETSSRRSPSGKGISKNRTGGDGRTPPVQLQSAVEKRVEKGKTKQIVTEARPRSDKSSPSKSKGKGKGKQVDLTTEMRPSRVTRTATKRNKPESSRPLSDSAAAAASVPHAVSSTHREIIPDSQEEQPQSLKPPSSLRGRSPSSAVMPDSQEEREAEALLRSSSPAIPLVEVISRQNSSVPTPTPAAVRSTLRRGELPFGVTHTRGSRLSVAKGQSGEDHVDIRPSEKSPVLSEEEEEAKDVDINPVELGPNLASVLDPEPEEDVDPEPKSEPLVPRPRVGQRKAAAVNTKPKRSVSRAAQKKVAKLSRSVLAGPSTGPLTRKRKNESDAESSRASDRGSVPLKKRFRGSATTTPAPSGSLALNTRVLARRSTKGNFYFPGTVTVIASLSDPIPALASFTVHFDDGSEEDVDVEHMRQFELEPEDCVFVSRRNKGKSTYRLAEVLEVDRWKEAEIAEVHEMGKGPDGDDYDVQGRFMKVSEEKILEQWNERCVSTRTLYRDKDFEQPPANKSLAGMGFMVTLADLPKTKRSIVQVIETSGGVVYSDWSAIVSLTGVMEAGGKRMMGKVPEMRMLKESRKAIPKSLFCLTDEPRTTPKYLLALALGVPCLSIDWVLERVMEDDPAKHVDWQAYVLPAGQNPVTRLAASQGFDRAWWRDHDNLPKLLSNSPILKPFAGKAFLCIGSPDFLFPKKEFGTFPKLILAMGASYVQAVVHVSRVSTKSAPEIDYTVVDDGDDLVPYEDAAAVNVSWIKKCLFTGVRGPTPWPDREV